MNTVRKITTFSIALAVTIFAQTTQAETLQSAVRYAIETNPDVLFANSNRLASDETITQARAGFLPTVDLTGAYGKERSRNPTTVASGRGPERTLTRSEAGIIASQNIFRGFGDQNEVARTKAETAAAAYEVNASAQAIGLRVVETYLDILRTQELVRVAKRNVEIHKQTFKMIQKRTLSGLSRKADLVQAQARLALAKSNLKSEQNNYLDAITNYIEVVGKEPHQLQSVRFNIASFPHNRDAAVNQALAHNPSLKAAKADVVAAEKQHEAAKAPNYPSIDVIVSASRNDNLDGVKGTNNDELAMVAASYNLFNGGADVARQRETAHLLQAAKEVRNRTLRQVKQTTRLSWTTYRTAQRQIPDLKQHRDSAKETVRLYQKQFQIGKRTLLDVLDSENEFFTSSIAYINGRYTELFGKYRVLTDMGDLTHVLHVPLPPEAYVPEYENHRNLHQVAQHTQHSAQPNSKHATAAHTTTKGTAAKTPKATSKTTAHKATTPNGTQASTTMHKTTAKTTTVHQTQHANKTTAKSTQKASQPATPANTKHKKLNHPYS